MQNRLTERMSEKFDAKDRKILSELDKNCRENISEIAKRTGLSKQLTTYRINNLLKEQSISRFLTIFNFRKFGYDVYYVLVEFQNLTREKEEEILTYIGKNPAIAWLVTTYGKWNLVFCVMSKSISDFNETLREISGKYNSYIKEHMFVVGIENIHSTKDYLLESTAEEFITDPKISSKDIFNADEIDLKIMDRLYLNPRETITDIAKKTKLNPETVRKRIKRYLDEKVILRFTIEINPGVVNYEWHLLFLEFSQTNPTKENHLKEFLCRNKNVTYITTTVGKWNLLVDFHVSDYEHLYQTIYELKDKYGDMIKGHDNLRISKVHKCSFLPDKLFRS